MSLFQTLYDRVYHLLRTLGLLFHTGVFALRWMLAVFTPSSRPRLLRLYCERCGATLVKGAQLLAMRQDLLPQEYIDELAKLLDEVKPEPYEVIEKTIRESFGDTFDARIASIEREPLGAASIAQVHGAVLTNGERVAIKVKRPKIDRRFHIDLVNLKLFVYLLDRVNFFGTPVSDFLGELARVMLNELDFPREARHMQLMRDLFLTDDVDHYVPDVFKELSDDRIIVMEWISGVRINVVRDAVRENDTEALARMAERGIDPKQVANTMFDSILEQVFRHKVFHADPHAGNVVALDGGTIAYLDFGIVAHLDEEMWGKQWALFEAVAREDVHAAYQAIVDVMSPLTTRSMNKVQVELKDRLWQWIVAARTGAIDFKKKSSARLIFDCAEIGRKFGLRLPWRFLVSHRATLLSDALVFVIDPEIDSLGKMRAFFGREMRRRKLSQLTAEQMNNAFAEGVELALSLPGFVNDLRRWSRQGIPEYLREYREQVSTFDSLASTGLLYLKRLLLLAIGCLLFFQLQSQDSGSEGSQNMGLEGLRDTVAEALQGDNAFLYSIGVLLLSWIFVTRILRDARRESA
jgi:ubiquinone biosynthesis protein